MSLHPSLTQRKIIHVDMDAYYASVEILDYPELKGLPLVIGAPPHSRGVVTTASYEARKFGIRSAMGCYVAYKLCPHAIFKPPRFARYKEIAQQIRAIFYRYTDLVEPMSLDEAYLDVTENKFGMYAVQIAKQIQTAIHEELGLSCSAGVAPNKMVAKIASDFRKPGGITVVLPEQVADFMRDLSVRKISGVGAVTEKRLNERGIKTCRDVLEKSEVMASLGDLGMWLTRCAQGIDERPVEVDHERKSYGREETFAKDLKDPEVIAGYIVELAQSIGEGLKKHGIVGRTITLKVKYSDFQSITRRLTIAEPTCEPQRIAETAKTLMARTEIGVRPIRLIGVSMGSLSQC